MFTRLTIQQAHNLCQRINVLYHHHDSIARKYNDDDAFIHFFSFQYSPYTFKINTRTGEIIFYNEDAILRLEETEENLYKKLVSSPNISKIELEFAEETHKEIIERREYRNNRKKTVLEYLQSIKDELQ